MDTKLISALVAAAAAVFVAVISLVTAILTSRQSAKTARSIELLKQSLSNDLKTSEFADATLISSLDALKQGMQAIQILKDEIQLILAAVKGSLTSREAFRRIEKARDSLLIAFQAGHPHLGNRETYAFHSLKELAIKICNIIKSDLHNKENVSELSDDARHELLELRGRLTDVQNILRDARTDRLVDRTVR